MVRIFLGSLPTMTPVMTECYAGFGEDILRPHPGSTERSDMINQPYQS